MATGYSAFLKDSQNDIAADRILGLSVSIEDDYNESEADNNKHSQGCLHILTNGTCFNTDDVRGEGCSAWFKRGIPRTKNTLSAQEKETLLALINGEYVEVQDVQKKQSTTKTSTSSPLVAGRKWVSGKTKAAFYSVYGKLLKDDEGPATTPNEKSDPADEDVSAIKEELNNARLLLFFMDKDAKQEKKEQNGHDSDDGTVDTEKDSSC